ncbi:hypothetical protein [Paenibacillus sp. SN-8-1]|uniref:hypothetical protein n=1 Tax=Paenibacillus sp. SN-8-1 TaxID=3435409 RepID=UPI003D9A3CB0
MTKVDYALLRGFIVGFLLLFVPENLTFVHNSIIEVGEVVHVILQILNLIGFISVVFFGLTIIFRSINYKKYN